MDVVFVFHFHVCLDGFFFEKRVSVRYICCLSNCDAPLLFSKWGRISGYEFENSGKNKEPDVKVHPAILWLSLIDSTIDSLFLHTLRKIPSAAYLFLRGK